MSVLWDKISFIFCVSSLNFMCYKLIIFCFNFLITINDPETKIIFLQIQSFPCIIVGKPENTTHAVKIVKSSHGWVHHPAWQGLAKIIAFCSEQSACTSWSMADVYNYE